MKIALAQTNPTIGDFEGNAQKILFYAEKAREAEADLVVFPELSLCGYPPRDLLTRKEFVEAACKTLESLRRKIRDIAVVVGYPAPNESPFGPRLLNKAVVFKDGEIISQYAKALLPTYDVYEETRYFSAVNQVDIFQLCGLRIGLTVCEDVWNLPGYVPYLYPFDPLKRLAEKKVDLIINISASPYFLEKGKLRLSLLGEQAKRTGAYLVYCNQVGANDHLIFDGHSLVVSPEGNLLARGPEFEEALILCDLTARSGDLYPVADRVEASLLKALVTGVRDYFRKTGFSKALIGLSGGIDSSVTACIASLALGPENVIGVLMPSPYTSQASIEDAEALAVNLGITTYTLPITEPFAAMRKVLQEGLGQPTKSLTEENIQARLRGNILMALANEWNCLVLNTGNKSEVAVGYCTLYGDTCGALAVLSDVSKGLVYALAREINRQGEIIPQRVLEKPPSAELRPDQKDEDDLPPYRIIDKVVKAFVEEGKSGAEIVAQGFEERTVREILRRLRIAEYKRWQFPPGLKVTPQAFGFGWRYPLAQKFRFDDF